VAPRQQTVQIGQASFSNALPLAFICGPCQIESREQVLEIAQSLAETARRLDVDLVFKASFDKANRTSLYGPRGVGLKAAIPIFQEVRERFKLPVITDVHEREHCFALEGAVDALQIPAFLCRQTDLLVAAAKTWLPVNVKKGQFMAPWDMAHVAAKIEGSGNPNVLLTERGTSFGYNNLVVDMRSLPIMKGTGHPVIFDATHSVQIPGGQGTASGGQREYVEPLARAAVAMRVAGVFIETHPNPDAAFSDGPNMVPLYKMHGLIKRLTALDDLVKSPRYTGAY
jgi:2-dehydro-3-deoxyphosphooctonate aldolase (KDO 8-P synthase)